MRYSTVIKALHRNLTLVLLLLVTCFAIYQYILSKPNDDRLYASKQLNENNWLILHSTKKETRP